MNLKVTDLLRLKNAKVVNADAIEGLKFKRVSIDSRNCGKNELFFAIKGERFDGHDFVKDVFKGGTRCVVVSKKWHRKLSDSEKRSFKNKCFVTVEDTTLSMGELANLYRRKFLIPVIGVAGSNGKTTTKDFIAHVLSKKYNVLKTEGNLNNAIGVPLTLFRLKKEHNFAVIELGTNHFKEIEHLCKVAKPQFGVLTNIGKEHLEFLKNIKGVAKAEGELVEYLKETYGTFFLNADDKYISKMPDRTRMNVFSYGTKGRVDVKGKVNGFNSFYPEAEIKYHNRTINTTLKNIGFQSFNAALSAAAIGFYFEVPVNSIKKAVSEYKIESGKRNQLKNIGGIWVIDDTYNSNPDSVISALENLKAYKVKGNKYIVLGDMLELGRQSKKEHKEIGRYIKKLKLDNLFTFGKDSYQTFLGAKGLKNNYHFTEKETLAKFITLNIKKGDVMLVKGSRSMKMEEVIQSLSKGTVNNN
jgi:UDP-N-acetylmuramoyl-tripeptide--D-alanyl-D-alanine ligase